MLNDGKTLLFSEYLKKKFLNEVVVCPELLYVMSINVL